MSDVSGTPKTALNQATIQAYVVDACGGDFELVLQMVDLYLNSAVDLVLEMEEGLTKQDFEVTRRSAHALKAGSRMFSAETLADYCQIVEDETKAGQDQKIREHLAAMRSQIEWLQEALPATCREMMA